MLNWYELISDRLTGKAPKGAVRSPLWGKVRVEFLKANPYCAVCGGTKKLVVHHKIPFHIAPDLELNEQNLITLCTAKKRGINCHLFFGHLGNYRNFNLSCQADTDYWRQKLK